MKKIKIYLSFIAVFALLFTSCSKDEGSNTNDSDKATLSFGAIVADLAAKSTAKQSAIEDMPACSDDDPAYVEIVLMQGDNEVVGTAADPYRVDLVAGQVFTEEDEALELVPGNYSLNHFSVYDAQGDLLWLAPRGGTLAAFVDNSLPLAIELGAGVKKYVDVSVLCYDDRDVNLYGYQFFELDINEAFEFCFFANYCTPEGRHFPARYSVDLSIDGNTLYEGVVNTTGRNNDGDLFAEALCFALPNLEAYEDNEEYIDYTLTLLDWTDEADAYGDVEEIVITGSLSRAEIMANFDGEDNVEYEHFRFGCGDEDQEPVDSDGDGVVDGDDNCPNEAGPASNNGCPEPTDSDGDGVVDGEDNCPNEAGPASNNGCPEPTDSDGDGVVDGEDNCPNEAGPASNNGCPEPTDSDGDGVVDGSDNCPNTPSGATVDSNGCPTDSDGDGIFDGIDECPGTESGVEVDELGCPLVEECAIENPDAGCTAGYLEGESGWFLVEEPADFAEAYFLLATPSSQDPLSTVTISLSSGIASFIINSSSELLVQDYIIEVSQTGDNSSTVFCLAENNITPATGDDPDVEINLASGINYPFYARIQANICPEN